MNANVLRALEFDRIVEAVADLAVTPTGHEELIQLHPLTDPAAVAFAQKATTEGTRFLADHPGFRCVRHPTSRPQPTEAAEPPAVGVGRYWRAGNGSTAAPLSRTSK